ncbi:hypothetical protein NDU88_006254 [Pleurodeles waltl]|uniref:Uncharacterized protein n=1 Tax=Pleurodeles waltl TaxID=8319 RepID=A0AAV7VP66_PLEWA|nr:hypothetical protein NDU88_006254 [Pleurodeles waltl]
MTRDECDTLDNNVMANVIPSDLKDDIQDAIFQGKVYEGSRIAFAKPVRHRNYWDHAEYQLLVPDGSGESPVQRLLKKMEPNQCVLFHSLLSPCLDYCIDPQGFYSFLPYLNVFENINNNYKAFSFSYLYKGDQCCPTKDQLWDAWRQIRDEMPFYRCDNRPQCIECFAGGQQSKEQCLQGFPQA